jgi:hypothetical protein
MVFVSSSDDGPAPLPEVPAGTALDAVPPAPAVDPGPPAGAAVVGGAVVVAVGGTVPAGSDVLAGALDVAVPGAVDVAVPGAADVAVPGAVELTCDCPGACAEAGRGVAAASTAQQNPTVTRRRRIRRHRLTDGPSLNAARR